MGIKFTAEQHGTEDAHTIGDRKYRLPSQSPAVCPLFHLMEAPSQVPGMSHSCHFPTIRLPLPKKARATSELLPRHRKSVVLRDRAPVPLLEHSQMLASACLCLSMLEGCCGASAVNAYRCVTLSMAFLRFKLHPA